MANEPEPKVEQPAMVWRPVVFATPAMPQMTTTTAYVAEPAPTVAPAVTPSAAPAAEPVRVEKKSSRSFGKIFTTLLLGAIIGLPLFGDRLGSFSMPSVGRSSYVEPDAPFRPYEASLRTTYRGEPVYYSDGRWYVRQDGHWTYFRDEPAELSSYRRDHVRPVRRGVSSTYGSERSGAEYERRFDTKF